MARDASTELPFVGAIEHTLTSAAPIFDEVDEVIGMRLTFGTYEFPLSTWEGEVDTSPR